MENQGNNAAETVEETAAREEELREVDQLIVEAEQATKTAENELTQYTEGGTGSKPTPKKRKTIAFRLEEDRLTEVINAARSEELALSRRRSKLAKPRTKEPLALEQPTSNSSNEEQIEGQSKSKPVEQGAGGENGPGRNPSEGLTQQPMLTTLEPVQPLSRPSDVTDLGKLNVTVARWTQHLKNGRYIQARQLIQQEAMPTVIAILGANGCIDPCHMTEDGLFEAYKGQQAEETFWQDLVQCVSKKHDSHQNQDQNIVDKLRKIKLHGVVLQNPNACIKAFSQALASNDESGADSKNESHPMAQNTWKRMMQGKEGCDRDLRSGESVNYTEQLYVDWENAPTGKAQDEHLRAMLCWMISNLNKHAAIERDYRHARGDDRGAARTRDGYQRDTEDRGRGRDSGRRGDQRRSPDRSNTRGRGEKREENPKKPDRSRTRDRDTADTDRGHDKKSKAPKNNDKGGCRGCGSNQHWFDTCSFKGHPEYNADPKKLFKDTAGGAKTHAKFDRWFLGARQADNEFFNKDKNSRDYYKRSSEKRGECEEPPAKLRRVRSMTEYETVVEVDSSDDDSEEGEPQVKNLATVIQERLEQVLDQPLPAAYEDSSAEWTARPGIRRCARLPDRVVPTERGVYEDISMDVHLAHKEHEDCRKCDSTELPIVNCLLDTGSHYANFVSSRIAKEAKIHSRKDVKTQVQTALEGPEGTGVAREQITFEVIIIVNKNKKKRVFIEAFVLPELQEDIIIGTRAQQTNRVIQKLLFQNHLIAKQCLEQDVLARAREDAQTAMSDLRSDAACEMGQQSKNSEDGKRQNENSDRTETVRTAQTTDADVTLPTNIAGPQSLQDSIRAVLDENSRVFSRELRAEPAKIEPMELVVDESKWFSQGNSQPPRFQGEKRNLEIMKQVVKMVQRKVVKHSQSKYYSQVLLTPKPNGDWRFCVDYRQLNLATKPERWPIPNISEMINRLGNQKAEYWGVLDLTKGYYQAPLSADSQKLTAFITKQGVYEWMRVAMGLTGAPSYFQRQMTHTVLNGLVYDICEVYLDDIIVYGKTEEEFTRNLRTVLQRLNKFNITVNPDKCQLGLAEVEYVGHTLNKEGKNFTREKLQKVVDFAKPQTQGQMKSFLGLANYFRDHIQNHSTIVEPLQRMTDNYKKSRAAQWTEAATRAFEEIKQKINLCPTLFFPDTSTTESEIHLYTDASDIGWGGYLCQRNKATGVETPIGFVSKTFNPVQRRWSVPEREAYAIYEGIRQFAYTLRDAPFTLHTDHKNLTYIRDSGSPKVLRWKLELMEYSFNLVHVPGVDNDIADYMSRNSAATEDDITQNTAPVGTAAQYLSRISNAPMDENYDDADDRDFNFLRSQQNTFVTIPDDKYELIKAVHNGVTGHHGVERTLELLQKQGHKWKYMRGHVKKFLQECDCCQKMNVREYPISTKPYTTGGFLPFEQISVDTIGPFVENKDGHKYAVVIIDGFSRWADVYPVRNTLKESVADVMLEHFGRFGTPSRVLTDGGPEYHNGLMEAFVDLVGAEHVVALANSKQENSIVERCNKEIGRWIRDLIYERHKGDKKRWAELIPFATRLHNATTIQTTGYSPAEIVFGRSIELERHILVDRAGQRDDTPVQEWLKKRDADQLAVIAEAKRKQQKHRAEHDNQPMVVTEFPKGSYVLLGWPVSRLNPSGRPTKWDTMYRGPYKVLGHEGQRYSLQNLVTGKQEPPKSVHLLRPFEYDRARTDPREVALRDVPDMYFVEEVLAHKGNFKRKGTVQFKIRWLGYDASESTWEPWANVRLNEQVHQYMKEHGLERWIPSIISPENEAEQE